MQPRTMERSAVFLMGICLLIGSSSSTPVTEPINDVAETTEKPLPDLGYLAMAPKVLITGTTESVCIHLLSFDPQDPIEVSVVLMNSDNTTELSSAPLYIMESQHDCVSIQVPETLEDYAVAILKIQVKHMFAATTDFEVVDFKKVQIRSLGSDTFIQTDKPIYKPGQTVFFRIMTLDQELKPDTSPFSEIWIEAPSGSRLAQWKNEKTEDGLIDLNMPMTSEPQLGEWKIVAIQNGEKTEQTFKVDEYVLPKFEVVVTTPPFVLINVEEFEVKVCGIYTYGQPVEGSFSGVIKVKTEGYEYRPRPVVAIAPLDTGKSGCGTIMVNASELKLGSTDHSIWNAHIFVDVDFTETNTGVSISESAKAGKVSSDALLMNVLAPSTFKPGVPYFGEIEVKFPDNSPAGGQFIRMSAKTNDGEIFEKNFTSPANGLIEFEVPDIAIESDKLEIYAWAPGHGNDDGTYDYRVYSIYDPATTFYVKPRYSPSGSFMQMSPIRSQVDANSDQTIDIYYTSDLEENVEELFTFIFMSRGDILDVPVETVPKRRRRESPPGPVIDNERVGSCPPIFEYEDYQDQICGYACSNDYDCPSREKCCDAECPGGNKACLPFTIIDPPVRVAIKIHRGDCPVINETVGVDCAAIQFACEHDGECQSDQKCCSSNCGTKCVPAVIGCTEVCPFIFSPVCGSDGRTYTSQCVSEQHACKNNLDINIVHQGECLRTPPPREPVPTKCQQAVLDAGELIPGKYIPQCAETGEYELMQCHGSTGYCWCVNTEGEELLETRQRFSQPQCEQEPTPPEPCPTICDNIFEPVCGTKGRTFANECSLRRLRCLDPDLKFAHTGACNVSGFKAKAVVEPECPDVCAEIYSPVCGTDQRTYDNICSLKQAACLNLVDVKFDYDGECIDPEVHCPLACTFEFAPVCGSDGHSYSNACDLRSTRLCVAGNQNLTLVHQGSCEDSVTTTQEPLTGHVGVCPPVDELEAFVGVCAVLCTEDNECNVTEICCPTFCGGRSCLSTIQIQPPEPDCPSICPAIYSPVCGSDGETYPSYCDLRSKACRENPDLYQDYFGECQPDVEIATPGQLKTMQRKFRVTPDMSPVVRVMVYYIRPDGEVIADAMTIKVQPTFENQVKINFAEKEAKPGSSTQLTVSAAPNSLCALGIVDKSVQVLGGDNTISKDKVFSALEKYQLSEAGGQVEWSTHCPNSNPWWWRGEGFRRRKRSYLLPTSGIEYDDASRSFQDMGLVFLSNLDVETRPCSDPYRYPILYRQENFVQEGLVAGSPGPPEPIALEDNFVQEGAALPDEQPEEAGKLAQLRTYFPETWLWNLERTGPTGNTTVELEVPHTITEWISNGFCTSFETGLGVSSPSRLKAFQPFFVSLTLPYSIIRGESVPVLATIFNYLDQCLVIEATYVEDERMPLVDATKQVQQICVCGGDSESITFQVVPDALGNMPIRVDAASVADTNLLCGNDVVASDVRATDAIEKELLVEAEGVEQEVTYSNYVCPQDFRLNTYYERVPLLLPLDFVEGSERAKVQVTGDMMGPTLNNLENLVQRPYGCGEQNMLGFVPNIQVMRYLTSTDQLTADIENRAKNNMKMGYQRELNYRRDDGSYSAFGNSDPEGSTWLTAFVMWSFAQANDYIEIDEKDLNVSLNWLRQQQDVDGCFISVGQVHHKAMKGGVNNGVTLSAYVLMAMLEGGIEAEDPAVINVIDCLHKSVDTLSDTYTAAQMAYALALAGSDRLDDVLTKLESLATEEGK